MYPKLTPIYVLASVGYSCLRKLPMLYDAKINSYYPMDFPSKHTKRPMLYSEKFCILAISTLYSPFVAPFWLMKDISLAEIYLRKDTKEKYGFNDPDSVFEYLIA